jgi:hypothetical protein
MTMALETSTRKLNQIFLLSNGHDSPLSSRFFLPCSHNQTSPSREADRSSPAARCTKKSHRREDLIDIGER